MCGTVQRQTCCWYRAESAQLCLVPPATPHRGMQHPTLETKAHACVGGSDACALKVEWKKRKIRRTHTQEEILRVLACGTCFRRGLGENLHYPETLRRTCRRAAASGEHSAQLASQQHRSCAWLRPHISESQEPFRIRGRGATPPTICRHLRSGNRIWHRGLGWRRLPDHRRA